ncbi:hypothetical protein GCM10017771_94050 [Streptomyces capitiformicae]|uniref:Uncharacterized protein n=1 Tax=Streptomyces capitiformicae TaxID=2014920 RepID=A0A918ZV55_9ACTN|nr:hypothetical protein GCM10017771_94050 [Streptomyces capitiformicae]
MRVDFRGEPADLDDVAVHRNLAGDDRPVLRVDGDMGDPSPQRIQYVRQSGEFVCQVT